MTQAAQPVHDDAHPPPEPPAIAPSSPLVDATNHRLLSPDYDGPILLWDIDKTYLDTKFSSLRGLLRIPFEFAVDKRPVPGAVPLLQGLRWGPDPKQAALTPLYFVSGSPPQLRRVIERRMLIDGVEWDGIAFKNSWPVIRAGRLHPITHQVGYKLLALLLYRLQLPPKATWLMFGDDVEADAAIFVLFGSICAGLRGADLVRQLQRQHQVQAPEAQAIAAAADMLSVTEDPITHIFIRRVRGAALPEATDPRLQLCDHWDEAVPTLQAAGRLPRG